MSERFEVLATEHGMVRLFAVDLPKDEIAGLDVAASLGVGRLDPERFELFALDDLKGLGLAGYMHEGLGISRAELDVARLDALEGHVLILRSAAFGGQAVVLTPRAPLRWIGTYAEETAPVQFTPLPAASAQGVVTPTGKAPPSDAAMSGRIATLALLVIFALTALVVWVAG